MKWLLLEEFIPSDDKFVQQSIESDDCDDTKYTPTVEFLKSAYSKLNDMFLDGRLPKEGIEFKIDRDLKVGRAGCTNADDSTVKGHFKVNYISLNGTLMKTPRSWIETIIHEMIHVDDLINHPEHFKRGYNEHKGWFEEQARKFEKYGFNVTEKDESDMKTSEDDDRIKSNFDNAMFLELGYNPVLCKTSILKISKRDKDAVLSQLKKRGCKSVKVLKTDNLNSTRLRNISKSSIGKRNYELDDDFDRKYGPFEEVETIDLKGFVSEATDEHDETLEVLKQIKGLSVKKLGNGKYRLKLS